MQGDLNIEKTTVFVKIVVFILLKRDCITMSNQDCFDLIELRVLNRNIVKYCRVISVVLMRILKRNLKEQENGEDNES